MIKLKQIIPFRKEIDFKTMINKITSISLENTLSLENDYLIKGDFLIEGTYKMTEASTIEEEFSYKIPVEINIDEKYGTSNITIDVDDFTYEIEDDDKLLVKIDLIIDKLIEQETVVEVENFDTLNDLMEKEEVTYNREDNDEDLFLETSKKNDLSISNDIIQKIEEIKNNAKANNIEEKEEKIELNNESNTNNIGGVESIFSAFSNTDETFSTYLVYIVRESDTIDSIISKYNTSRELLEEYNDLNNITIGSKIIIPDFTNE